MLDELCAPFFGNARRMQVGKCANIAASAKLHPIGVVHPGILAFPKILSL
jgi:hypothetical protein